LMSKKLNWLKKLDSDSLDICIKLTGVSMKKEKFLKKVSRFFQKVVMLPTTVPKRGLDTLNNLLKHLHWTQLKSTLISKIGL